MDSSGFKSVLIIKPSSLGDIIHALPVAASIKKSFPGADIDWLVGSAFKDILEGNPDLGRLILFDRGLLKGGRPVKRLRDFLRELRTKEYDVVLDLQGLLRSALMAAACRAKMRVGFANAREGAPLFYNHRVQVPGPDIHAVDRYLLALRQLGIRDRDGGIPEFKIVISRGDADQAEKIIKAAGITEGEPFAAIAPSARWETKRWPAGRFLDLARLLRERKGIAAVFIGSGEDGKLFDSLDASMFAPGAFAFGQTTLKGLAALLKRASLLITNDSGPMHVAAAVGTPCAAFFGPTDPRRTGPYGGGHKIITAGIDCAPCFRRDCGDVKCLTGITTEQAFSEIDGML